MRNLISWTRRNGWRIAQAALLAWIALELHQLTAAVGNIQPADMGGIESSLDSVAKGLGDIARVLMFK